MRLLIPQRMTPYLREIVKPILERALRLLTDHLQK